MTQFLLNTFITNPNKQDPAVRPAIGRLAGTTGIICNCLLALTKLLAGMLSGSVAIVADAANNLSDAVSSVVTLIGFRMAQRPADRDHPFGHARYEYLAGLIVAELILLVGFELGKASFQKILHPEPVPFTVLSCFILILSIGVKLWMRHFFHTIGQLIHSGTLEAASKDSRNDVIATASVLACYALSALLPIHLDGYAGLAVAVFILWSGAQVVRETISPLLGKKADQTLINNLTELVCSHSEILGVHDLLIHDYGPGQCFASLHAEMDADTASLESHDLLDHIESEALESLNVHLVIHCDPVATNDSQWEHLRKKAEKAAASVDPCLSIHDFRLIQCEGQPVLEFDLSVPYEYPVSDTELRCKMEAAMIASGIHNSLRISTDRNT